MEHETTTTEKAATSADVEVRFALRRSRVTVLTPDPGTADAVASLFRPLVAGAGGGAGAVLEVGRAGASWSLRDIGTGKSFRARRFRGLPSLLAATEFAVLTHLLAGHRHETHLHASGAMVGGRAILALGAPGAGKSSLALAWSRAGHRLLADDIVLVGSDGRVLGVPRLVKVERELLREHGLREADTVAPDPRSNELWWDAHEWGGGWSRRWSKVALVARVAFEPGARPSVTPLSAAEGLRALLDHVMEAGLEPSDSVGRLATIAESAILVALRFGSAEDAAEVLAELAGEVSP